MQKIKRNIPNAITCGNLLCGCLALVKAFEGDLIWAAYLVGIAVVLDFLDGFTARLLKVSSAIGKDLDSLADMVTFGVVPGVVMYQLIQISFSLIPTLAIRTSTIDTIQNVLSKNQSHTIYYTYVAFVIPIFSAIRLAKFNNDTHQTNSFIGLPTPANAIFICSLPLVLKNLEQEQSLWILNPYFLLLLSCILSLLLVAPLPLFALKFKSFGWKGNEIRYTFLILAAISLGIFQFVGIPLIIILYILMSLINNLFSRRVS